MEPRIDETLIDSMMAEDPIEWIHALPTYQRESIEVLLASGSTYDQVAVTWVTASAANTFRFSATTVKGENGNFLEALKIEIRAFLCGDRKYKKEREGLFGEKGAARTFVVSAMAVAIAPHVGVAAAVISPLIALLLAGLGKVVLNSWCSTQS